ncbi:hypothetical protein DYB30_011651 [Aphanomyces astaci]|uniref:Uncharacterized protein n=1 Tax=Aphanomyces astaci TaxID=112090 RepID=A0A397CX61_APHAT|nr:hypothetical protein DYB30_011651 [Aphanomyces astaci]
MKLLPLRDLCSDNPTSTFFHPQATSAATLVDTKVRIGRLPPLTTTKYILAALRGSRLFTPDVDITGDGYATLTFDTSAPIAFLWSTSGPHGDTRLYIRDIAVHLHILTVESLRAAKEALTALVSASSAAFTTLDARLLEERRIREAAELLQVEDNRLPTEAHIRLNTAVAQHETRASPANLPPAASMPPVNDSPANLLDTEKDEPTALGQGPDDNMGTDPDDHMASN